MTAGLPSGAPSGVEALRADEYDANRGGMQRGERFAAVLDPLFSGHEADAVTLDVGAGTGVVAKGLRDLGRRVVGIDRSHHMLAKAEARMGPRFARADAAHLPLREGSVGDAYSVWLLHLVDIPAVLREVARVLRPGGRYLVMPVSEGRPEDPPVRRLTDQMLRRLRGGAGPPDAPDRVAALAAGLPFRSLGVVEDKPEVLTTTPATVASLLERGGWFVLQAADERAWAEVITPTIDALRALPGPDEPVRYEVRARVLILERTGGA